jgi:outer membrane lipoprotein-sorting protein
MKKLTFLLSIMMCSIMINAQSSKEVLDKLSAKAKTWNTLSADFSSNLVDKKNNKNIKQEGNIKIKGNLS